MQVNAAGVAGTDSTFGDEVAATGLLGRTSLSVGQFHFQTDGFRDNNDLQHNIYTLFGQSDLTPSVSLQAEYRYRKTDSGDRVLNFDLDEFRSDFSDNIERMWSVSVDGSRRRQGRSAWSRRSIRTGKTARISRIRTSGADRG